MRAYFSEHDQISQFWEHISNQNQNAWVLTQLWIISSNHWTHIHTWYFIETSWSSLSSSQEIIQSSRNVIWIVDRNLQIQEMIVYHEHFMSFFNQ